jgi:hypothetical protein
MRPEFSYPLDPVILTKTWTLKNHTFTYDEKIKVESITQGVCDLALRFSDSATGEKASMVS